MLGVVGLCVPKSFLRVQSNQAKIKSDINDESNIITRKISRASVSPPASRCCFALRAEHGESRAVHSRWTFRVALTGMFASLSGTPLGLKLRHAVLALGLLFLTEGTQRTF